MSGVKLISVKDCSTGDEEVMCPNCGMVIEIKLNKELVDKLNDEIDELKIKIEKLIKKNLTD